MSYEDGARFSEAEAATGDSYAEARLRRHLATAIRNAMAARDITVRQLADVIGTSKSQVQRLTNAERGRSVTLLTVVRAARALDVEVEIRLRPRREASATVVTLHPWRTARTSWSEMRSAPRPSIAASALGGGA